MPEPAKTPENRAPSRWLTPKLLTPKPLFSLPPAYILILASLGVAVLQPIHAQQIREHILLARQVGVPTSQAIAIVIANELQHVVQQGQCRWNGGIKIFDITAPANPVEAEIPMAISLAAGQSVAIRNVGALLFDAPGSAPASGPKILDLLLVGERPLA